MNNVEKRFLEVAQNKDITDKELFEELCYLHAKSLVDMLDRKVMFENFKKVRKGNPSLTGIVWGPDNKLLSLSYIIPRSTMHHFEYYEMNKRILSLENRLASFMEQTKVRRVTQEALIQSLEQTLASFMEQTKVERLSQEAVMQSLSNELDEFQEEFYDCQSEVKEQKERIGLIEDALKETIQTVLERVPLKD